jgi:hypothetical protein
LYVLRQERYPDWDDGYGLQPQGGKLDDITVIVHKVPGDFNSAASTSRKDELLLKPGVWPIFGQQRRAKIAQQEVGAWCFRASGNQCLPKQFLSTREAVDSHGPLTDMSRHAVLRACREAVEVDTMACPGLE